MRLLLTRLISPEDNTHLDQGPREGKISVSPFRLEGLISGLQEDGIEPDTLLKHLQYIGQEI